MRRAKLQAEFDNTSGQGMSQEDEHDAKEGLVDDAYANEIIERWSALLHAIALYHQLENELKHLIKRLLSGYPDDEREAKLYSVHQWNNLRAVIKETCDRELTKIARYNDVNELRLVCNCVKHTSGRVSKDLADFTKNRKPLKRGENLKTNDRDLERYRAAVQEFLVDFARVAEDGLQKRYGNPR